MTLEVSTIVIVFGFLVLAFLASANECQLRKDRYAAHSAEARRFVRDELRRVRLRIAGWLLLFAGIMGRIASGTTFWDIVTTIIAAAAVLSFLADGILGRLERRRLLRRR